MNRLPLFCCAFGLVANGAAAGSPDTADLIHRLGDGSFEARQEAREMLPARLRQLEGSADTRELKAALVALKAARTGHDDLEVRQAACAILAPFSGGGAILERKDLPGPARGVLTFAGEAVVWGTTPQKAAWMVRVDPSGQAGDPFLLAALPGAPDALHAMDGKILAYGNLKSGGWVSLLKTDGKPLWTRDDLPAFVSLCRDAADAILVGGHFGGAQTEGNGWIGRLKKGDGALLWTDAGFPGPVTALETLPEGIIAAGYFRRSGWLRLLSHEGKPVWTSEQLTAPVSFLRRFPEGICVGGSGNRAGWTALFGMDGKEKWNVGGLPEWFLGLESPPEGILTGGADKHTGDVRLFGMDGKPAWKARLPGYPTCSLVTPDGILVSGGERKSGGWEGGGWAQFLSVKDGERLWETRRLFETSVPVMAIRHATDGFLTWGSSVGAGCAALLDRNGSLLWSRILPGTTSAVAPLSARLWIACGATPAGQDCKCKSDAGWLGIYRLRDADDQTSEGSSGRIHKDR